MKVSNQTFNNPKVSQASAGFLGLTEKLFTRLLDTQWEKETPERCWILLLGSSWRVMKSFSDVFRLRLSFTLLFTHTFLLLHPNPFLGIEKVPKVLSRFTVDFSCILFCRTAERRRVTELSYASSPSRGRTPGNGYSLFGHRKGLRTLPFYWTWREHPAIVTPTSDRRVSRIFFCAWSWVFFVTADSKCNMKNCI